MQNCSREQGYITDWQDIRNAYTKREKVPLFTHGQVITYFVTRTVSDGLPAGDFKGMNEKAKRLYECGHIQSVMVRVLNSQYVTRYEKTRLSAGIINLRYGFLKC